MGTSSAESFVYTVNLHCIVLELNVVVIFSSSYKENFSPQTFTVLSFTLIIITIC